MTSIWILPGGIYITMSDILRSNWIWSFGEGCNVNVSRVKLPIYLWNCTNNYFLFFIFYPRPNTFVGSDHSIVHVKGPLFGRSTNALVRWYKVKPDLSGCPVEEFAAPHPPREIWYSTGQTKRLHQLLHKTLMSTDREVGETLHWSYTQTLPSSQIFVSLLVCSSSRLSSQTVSRPVMSQKSMPSLQGWKAPVLCCIPTPHDPLS